MTAGIISSTLLITITTIDDAIWLIPYCTSPQLPALTKAIHGFTFIATLETLAILCVVIAKVFRGFLIHHFESDSNRDEGFLLEVAGAIICWAIAIGLYIKKFLKRRRRAMAVKSKSNSGEDRSLVKEDEDDEKEDLDLDGVAAEINAVKEGNSASDEEEGDCGVGIRQSPSIWMVISLTTLGALDEISYFPALLVGHVFTGKELCIGTLLASGIILAIVLKCLSKFKPLVDFLDTIPLYGIVGMFAIILTVGLFIS